MTDTPILIEGGLATDERGQLSFVNDFAFEGVKRCYMVSNHQVGFVRGWQAHRREAKYVMIVQGEALLGAVAVDDWQTPSKAQFVHRWVLSVEKPCVVFIPAGYANGFISLTEDAKLMFFSTSTLEDSQGDHIRFDPAYWSLTEK